MHWLTILLNETPVFSLSSMMQLKERRIQADGPADAGKFLRGPLDPKIIHKITRFDMFCIQFHTLSN